MSDLILDYTSLRPMPEACLGAPPASGPDPCSLTLPLIGEEDPSRPAREVRFDRRGDQFVLSPANSGDLLTWAGSHSNLPEILQTLRVVHSMTYGTHLAQSPGIMSVLTILAHYIVTGEAFDGATPEDDRARLASGLLDMLTDSPEEGLTAFMGRLSIIRSQDWLSAEARERVRWISEMSDLSPRYRALRRHFLDESNFTNWTALSAERRHQVEAIANFARRVILAEAFDQPLRYSDEFRAADAAYQSIYTAEIAEGTRPDFCSVLEAALSELRGARGVPARFLEDCRLASRLTDLPAVDAVRNSLVQEVLGEAGRGRLQASIRSESGAANMSVDWLRQQGDPDSGGRIGEVLDMMIDHVGLRTPEADGEAAQLTLDVAPMIVALNQAINGHSTRRREYLITALALVRTLVAPSGTAPAVRVFYDGEFRELHWHLTEDDRNLLGRFAESLEERLDLSQERSDYLLPVLEGALCAVGAAGLFATELVPELRSDSGLHLGLGTTAAGLGGAGCAALLGHFLWPEVTHDVHNSYLWDGLTGLGGAVIGVGIYLLVTLLGGSGGSMSSPRFPVDEYGP